MVVPEGVAVPTAVVNHPSHTLARMLVDEEHGVQCNAHHTAQGLRALGHTDLGRRSRQPHLQLAFVGKERRWS